MRKQWLLTLLVLIGIALPLAAQRGGEFEGKTTATAPAVKAIGKQWAVFIAIDQYAEWSQLRYPVKDAKDIKKILLDNYYVDEVRELYNRDATAAEIRGLFDELQRKTGINDSVFVFHAGHGIGGEETTTPAWIASDGSRDPLVKNGWLPHTEIRAKLDSLNAKHVFLISDSCYSGALLQQTRGRASEIIVDYPVAYNSISRQAMTSGAIEPVADESEFASRLKSLLLRTEAPYITPLFLCSQIIETKTMRNLYTYPDLAPIPQSQHIPGGNFLFFRKSPTQPPLPQVITPSPVVTETRPGRPQPANPNGDALVLAAINQDEAKLRQALSRKANVNHLYYDRTALMEACNNNWLLGVRILLGERANPNYVNALKMTALMFAARVNNNFDIVNLLIRENADKNITDAQNKTALMYAIESRNDQLVELLIDRGASISKTDNYNQDALIIAAKNNYTFAVIKLLNSHGFDLSQADIYGKTAFMYACEWENMQLIRLFEQKGADVLKANNVDGLPPLLWLIQWKKSYTVIEYLVRNTQAIASRDSNGKDAFWYLKEYDSDNTRLRQLLNNR